MTTEGLWYAARKLHKHARAPVERRVQQKPNFIDAVALPRVVKKFKRSVKTAFPDDRNPPGAVVLTKLVE